MKRPIFFIVNFLIVFTTFSQETGLFTDPRDGKVYKTIKIGDQWLMAENLAFKPENGNYWAYADSQTNVEKYGYLYDWKTAIDIAPKGWHLPTKEEWEKLFEFLGNDKQIVFEKMTEPDFNAQFGGCRTYESNNMGEFAYFWCATGIERNNAWFFLINKNSKNAYLKYNDPNLFVNSANCGYSVRLFKDIELEKLQVTQNVNETTSSSAGNNISLISDKTNLTLPDKIKEINKEINSLNTISLPVTIKTEKPSIEITIKKITRNVNKQKIVTSFTSNSNFELTPEGVFEEAKEGNVYVIIEMEYLNHGNVNMTHYYENIKIKDTTGNENKFFSFLEKSKDEENVDLWINTLGVGTQLKANSITDGRLLVEVNNGSEKILIQIGQEKPVLVPIAQ